MADQSKANYHQIQLPSEEQLQQIHQRADQNYKYKLIVYLMQEAGLRVTEVVRLQIRDFDFENKALTVRSLKKRKSQRDKLRFIPLTDNVIRAFAQYWSKLKDHSAEAYVFPAGRGSSKPHLDRRSVWRRIKKYSGQSVHPHMLRHHFASNVVSKGNDIKVAKELLGHKSVKTTEIYLHIPQQQLRRAIDSIQQKASFWQRLFAPPKGTPSEIPITRTRTGLTKFHVGRKQEIAELYELADKKVNTLLLGEPGIGKSHLLDNYQQGNIIRMDEFQYPKRLLGGLLLELFDNDKEEILKLVSRTESREQFETKVATRESIKRLCEIAIEVTREKEYTIVIDDVTNITKSGVRILENFKNHFHIIAAGRRVRLEYRTAFSNFEVIELTPLPRPESITLIERLSTSFQDRIEDFESYKNRIWEDTQGNPLFIIEMIERLAKEPRITVAATERIKHTASKNEVDFTVILIICISSLMGLRYMGSEFGEDGGAFRLIGGLALVFAIFARPIFRSLKRKWL